MARLNPMDIPWWRNRKNVDRLTIAAIEAAEEIAGKMFVITQGSYQGGGGDPLSAGTHDGGGVVDIRWSGDEGDVLALRKAGFAAWHRTPEQGPWPDHIHAVLVDHPKLSLSAMAQARSYRVGRNGLKSNGYDDGPRLDPIPVFEWPPDRARREVRQAITRAVQQVKSKFPRRKRVVNSLRKQRSKFE